MQPKFHFLKKLLRIETNILASFDFPVSDNKAEIKAAIWRIPPIDETEPPPPDSPGLSHSTGGGYTRPLQLVCELDNQNENMKWLVEMSTRCTYS